MSRFSTAMVPIVFAKELKDSFRDRRSLMAAFTFALAGPLFVAMMMKIMIDQETDPEPASIHVIGAEYAGDLMAHIRRGNFEFDEEAPVTLEIPENYAERFSNGQTVTLSLSADQSKSKVRRDATRLASSVRAYAGELGALRLMLRGISPSVPNPINIQQKDLSTPAAKGSLILGIVIVYLLLAAFIGSMPVSIDLSAGERERNSLEVLMAQPVSALAIFLGKWLTAAVFGVLGIFLVLVGSLLTFQLIPVEGLGFDIDLGLGVSAMILLNLLPLAGFAAAAQIVLAMYAKTYKEASAYLNMLSFVPAAVAFVVLIKEWEPERWMFVVPLLGHQQLLRTYIRAEPVDPVHALMLAASTIGFVALLIFAGTRLLGRERIVFGQGG